MAVEALSTTTLAEALTENTNNFIVTSTTNISVDDYIVCRAEAMKVREVIDSTRITVVRGVGGTHSRQHASGQRFYVGSPDRFQAIRASAMSMFGDSGTYPEFMMPGQRATDMGGNEYVLLDPAIAMVTGSTVIIDQRGAYTCTLCSATRQGSVAVLVEAATTAQYVWGQIYGYNSYVQEADGTSGVTSAYFPVAQSSAGSPSVGMRAVTTGNGEYLINGMFIVGAASSTTTSSTTSTGVSCPCWLNYPYTKLYAEGTSWAP